MLGCGCESSVTHCHCIQDARENLSKGLSLWLEQSADGQADCLPPPYTSRVNWAKMLIEVEEYEVHKCTSHMTIT